MYPILLSYQAALSGHKRSAAELADDDELEFPHQKVHVGDESEDAEEVEMRMWNELYQAREAEYVDLE